MKKKPSKGFSISEQIKYNMKRSKKGTKDRNGKKLSDFIRGKYLGKAQGQASMVKLHKKQEGKGATASIKPKSTAKNSNSIAQAAYRDGAGDSAMKMVDTHKYNTCPNYRRGFDSTPFGSGKW